MNRNSPDEHLSSPIGSAISPGVGMENDMMYDPSGFAMDTEDSASLFSDFVLMEGGTSSSDHHSEPTKQDLAHHPQKVASIVNLKSEYQPTTTTIQQQQPWGEWDVPLGRSQEVREFIGNLRYRELVEYHRPAYLAAARRSEKTSISNAIFATIRSQGGHFLDKQEPDTTTTTGAAEVWLPISQEKALAKISQALRIGTGKQPPNMPHFQPNQETTAPEVSSSSEYPGAGSSPPPMELEPSMSNMTISSSTPGQNSQHPAYHHQAPYPFWQQHQQHEHHHPQRRQQDEQRFVHSGARQPSMNRDFPNCGSTVENSQASSGDLARMPFGPDEEPYGAKRLRRYFGETSSAAPAGLIRHHSYDEVWEQQHHGVAPHAHRHTSSFTSLPAQSDSMVFRRSNENNDSNDSNDNNITPSPQQRRAGRRKNRHRSAPPTYGGGHPGQPAAFSFSNSAPPHSHSQPHYRLDGGLDDLGVGDDDLVLPPEFGWAERNQQQRQQQQQQQQHSELDFRRASSADNDCDDLNSSCDSFNLEDLMTSELGDIEPAPELFYGASTSCPDMMRKRKKGRSQKKHNMN